MLCPYLRFTTECTAVAAIQLQMRMRILTRSENSLVKGRQTGGFQTGGFPDLDLSFLFCPFVLFGTFPIFLGFPDLLGHGPGIFPICPFPLSRPTLRAPTRNSPDRVRDTIWTFPEKSGKHPGLETPRFSFSQSSES